MTVRNLDALFKGFPLVILGPAVSQAELELTSNIESSVPSGQCTQITSITKDADVPRAAVVVVMRADWVNSVTIKAFGTSGCRAILWVDDAPPSDEVLQAAKPYGIRFLGPRSAGVIHAGNHLNLSSLPLTPQLGTVALIAQSQTVAAAALDWAVGRAIGFSWLAITGAEVDVDAADFLDYAALDPKTRAVILQIGNIRHARKFMSAARATARLKPVLVLQTRLSTDDDRVCGPDLVRSAAFQRAGLVECETLDGLFDGLAALELLPSVPGDRIAVVGNGSGVCDLATAAVLREGMQLAVLTAHTQKQVAVAVPLMRFSGSAVDLGSASADNVLTALRLVLADAGVSAVLLIHSPMAGQPHQMLSDAIASAALGDRLLTVWLGLQSVQPARQKSSSARIATFASADDAVRAIHYRVQYRKTRELLRRTPPADTSLRFDGQGTTQFLQGMRAKGLSQLSAESGALVFSQYGMATETNPQAVPKIRIKAMRHAELGMSLSVQTETATYRLTPSLGLPPLDSLLAQRMLQDAGAINADAPSEETRLMSMALIRIGQLVIDQPLISRIDAVMAWADDKRLIMLPSCVIELTDQELPERERIALAPYPEGLTHEAKSRDGGRYSVRAVQPADEPAMLRLLARLDPEEIRLRFFTYIRHFSHDMASRVTQVDYDREITLVAIAAAEPSEIAAMATLIADSDNREAEYAVLVHHDHAGQGLGRHLLECLLQLARKRGIGKVHGDVLADNLPMLGLVRSLGFSVSTISNDAGCRHVEISIG